MQNKYYLIEKDVWKIDCESGLFNLNHDLNHSKTNNKTLIYDFLFPIFLTQIIVSFVCFLIQKHIVRTLV